MVKRIDRAVSASTSALNCLPEPRLLMVNAIFGGAWGEFVVIAAQFQFVSWVRWCAKPDRADYHQKEDVLSERVVLRILIAAFASRCRDASSR